jgi:hypothetical protein
VTVGIELLNIERYPIDDLDSDRGQAFLVECRQRMAIESSLILLEFVLRVPRTRRSRSEGARLAP